MTFSITVRAYPQAISRVSGLISVAFTKTVLQVLTLSTSKTKCMIFDGGKSSTFIISVHLDE